MIEKLIALFRRHRQLVTIIVALLVSTLSMIGAFLLRYDFDFELIEMDSLVVALIVSLPIKVICLRHFGVLSSGWRYASLSDLVNVMQAVTVSFLVLTLVLFLAIRLEGVPRSALVIDSFLMFLAFSFLRLLTRLVREQYVPGFRNQFHSGARTIVVGAGESGQSIVREARKNPDLPYQFIGFVDDDQTKFGMQLQGLPVLGEIDNVSTLCEELAITELIIAMPSATPQELKRILELASSPNRNIKTLPALADLINEKVSIQQIRDVRIEDLLGRQPVADQVSASGGYIKDKVVLVSGAAGSIGSEICRQLLALSPRVLVLLDIAESPLFYLEQELRELSVDRDTKLETEVGDVRNRAGLEKLFNHHKPSVVFHAAAYKHVPMMETHPYQASQTNILGTKNIADVAQASGATKFVLVSTDKAVNPTNVMGASKRCAELYVKSLQAEGAHDSTRFIAVRFGNVLDSAGSVIPIFKKQIAKGGPITVTHPDIIRYFMTIPEATLLVLEAGGIGRGGDILHLDMGEPVKILELAEQLIRLSGFVPGEDIMVEFSGLRPGEKLYEELLIEGEGVEESEHPSIRRLTSNEEDLHQIKDKIEDLVALGPEVEKRIFVDSLKSIVHEYLPS